MIRSVATVQYALSLCVHVGGYAVIKYRAASGVGRRGTKEPPSSLEILNAACIINKSRKLKHVGGPEKRVCELITTSNKLNFSQSLLRRLIALIVRLFSIAVYLNSR